MTPIERVSAKSRSLSMLGLTAQATRTDIRKAYKSLAFETHPDRAQGSAETFARVAEAYHYLNDNADALGIAEAAPRPVRPSRVSRPVVQSCETVFTPDAVEECRASLDTRDPTPQHVSTQLHRLGRSLTYFVPTPAANGLNRVAVPTGDLVDSRHVHPSVVTLDSQDLTGGVYDVPEHVCASQFPGARSVRIRFAA